MDQEELDRAGKYDQMINWDARLERELPLLKKYLPKGQILDLACASGRHSLALAKVGYRCLGLDVSEAMVHLARKLAETSDSPVTFQQEDLTLPNLKERLSNQPDEFDGAILLGNAIANMGSFKAASNLIVNVHELLRKGGRFIMHTINRPTELHYIPLRRLDSGTIVQRIMVPISGNDHNVELRVNFIDIVQLKYLQQASSPLYMFSAEEMENLLIEKGFHIVSRYGGFNQEPFSKEGGRSVVWVVEAI